jgi:hypothetical protein
MWVGEGEGEREGELRDACSADGYRAASSSPARRTAGGAWKKRTKDGERRAEK